MNIAILGAGIAGLSAAYCLTRAGARVTVYEAGGEDFRAACSHAAGGMLAPYCEMESCAPVITTLGEQGLALWRDVIAADVGADTVGFHACGSLVLAHPRDTAELTLLQQRAQRQPRAAALRRVDAAEIDALEPVLAGRFTHGLYAANEGHVDPRAALRALYDNVRQRGGMFHFHTYVDAPNALNADWVIDCRGLGADDPALRAVKGEMLMVRTRDIDLRHVIRVAHPRFPLYIVPRGDGVFMIGATMIESDRGGHVSVRSALELLSALYVVHPAFAEADILEMNSALRPAYADHLPKIKLDTARRALSINGLYRHGFLLAPVLAQAVTDYIVTGAFSPTVQERVYDDYDHGQRTAAHVA